MKKLNLSLLILLLSISMIGFTGCKDPEPAHEHTFAEDWTKDSTNHWHVSTCGHEVTDGKAVHTFGEWQVTKEATCIEKGERKATCTVCNFEKTEVSDKVSHSFGEYVSNNDATTEADGTKTRECSACGYKDTVTDEGSKIHVHTFAEEWTSDSSGHWHAATCKHTTEVSEKAEHIFGKWTTTKEATEEAEGSKERTCTVCGYTVTEAIEKLDHTHTFAEEWTKDETNHWHAATCGHDVTYSKAEHSFVNEVCTICEYSRIPEDFVLIPAGTFQMGSEKGYDDNKPVHQVTITKDFYMGKFEVTQAEYEKYCSYTGSSSPSSSYGDGNNYPAYYVSWYDALVYCNKRSIAEGLTPCYSISDSTDPEDWGEVPTSSDSTWNLVECNWNANGYRLPTEAEWEYAARAGDNTVDSRTYSGTSNVNKLGEYAWYESNSNDATHEVGTKLQNAYGLYDMSGNVWEWCWNWFTNSYDTGKEGGSDPTGASAGSDRVSRGGSWYSHSDNCAVSYRNLDSPDYRDFNLGFRVVRSAS